MDAQVQAAAGRLGQLLEGRQPEVLLTLGSGLTEVADALTDPVDIEVAQVEGLLTPTVPGHTARLRCGTLGGQTVLAQLGRTHLYEGHDVRAVTRMVEVAATLGCTTFVVTNAAGGLDPALDPGDLLVIDDHLNLTGRSPLTGMLRDDAPVFLDLVEAYDADLRRQAHIAAEALGIELRHGVYAGVVGPAYETPAEVAMLRTLGAQVVGMSTVNEVVAANAHGMRVLGLSSITNVHGHEVATSHQDVLEVGARATGPMARLLLEVLGGA